jgi:hypothetical protein
MDTYRQLIFQIAIPKLTVNICPPGVKKKINYFGLSFLELVNLVTQLLHSEINTIA